MSLPILPLLPILLIGLPILELYVLIKVGGSIGAFSTVYLVILTAILGVWLVRRQGMGVVSRIRAAAERGEPPAVEMIEGGLLLLSGFFLLVPGFVTDTLGFLLLVPPLRRVLVLAVVRRIQVESRSASPAERPAIDTTWKRDDRD